MECTEDSEAGIQISKVGGHQDNPISISIPISISVSMSSEITIEEQDRALTSGYGGIATGICAQNGRRDKGIVEMDSQQSYPLDSIKGCIGSSTGILKSAEVDTEKVHRSHDHSGTLVPLTSFTVREQLNEIWLTVQLKAVWRPMVSAPCS